MPKWLVQKTTRKQHEIRKITRHNIDSQQTVSFFVFVFYFCHFFIFLKHIDIAHLTAITLFLDQAITHNKTLRTLISDQNK